jgi:hypothetical protein
MKIDNFFAELKRRNVIRFAGLYHVGAWLLTQIASTMLPMFGAPDWLPRGIVSLLAIGFIPALIFSWVFELTPQGLKRDEDVRPEDSIAHAGNATLVCPVCAQIRCYRIFTTIRGGMRFCARWAWPTTN